MRKKVSVIIPFLNEEENIPFLVEELNRFFSLQTEYKTEINLENKGAIS